MLAMVVAVMVNLYDYQKQAINQLKTGSILCGGVGSGKSRTAIAYYFFKECFGNDNLEMKKPKNLYIITTAKKRDSLEWEGECIPFAISTKSELSISKVFVKVDSWNNINKYINVKDSFFIFDEQRLVGSGTWVKSFLKISKNNNWILLSATPGDTWSDYIPVFLANGFYKNRTEFLKRHAVYNRFTRYPKIDRYIECDRLIKFKNLITVTMEYKKSTISHDKIIMVDHNKESINKIMNDRWNIFKSKPIKNASELCYIMRKVVNTDPSRISAVKELIKNNQRLIIFYNFDYELEILKSIGNELKIKTCEWNGHTHQEIPKDKSWIYLVQYTAGAEGWNCIETDTIVFYSQNYSYKIMIQSAGRIDRLNTPFKDLYYYHLRSNSKIDLAITQALKKKKDFNIRKFIEFK